MKLIIVTRTKPYLYAKLKKQFEDEIGVEVVLERRAVQRRQNSRNPGPERRSRDRRRFVKPFDAKGYIVIYMPG